MTKNSLILLIMFSFTSAFSQQPENPGYKIINKIPLQGDEKWDYLFSEDQTGLLFVSHGTSVQVVDQKKGKVVGKIADLDGVHGIAIAPDFNKGYISTKNDNSVTIFDTRTLKLI